jgi:hypothetical protein
MASNIGDSLSLLPTSSATRSVRPTIVTFHLGIAATEAYRELNRALINQRVVNRALKKRARPLRTRNRVTLEVKALEGKFAEQLSKDATLWFQRLHGFYSSQQSQPSRQLAPSSLPPLVRTPSHASSLLAAPELPAASWSLEDLTSTQPHSLQEDALLTLSCPTGEDHADRVDERHVAFSSYLGSRSIHQFNDFLHHAFDENPSSALSAQAVRRGLVHLLGGVRLICGGNHLSQVSGSTLFLAQTSVHALLDAQSSWNRLCSVAANNNEINRVMFHVVNGGSASPRNALDNLFDILVSEMQFFQSFRDALLPMDITIARRLCGFCQFALFLSRPASRAQLLSLIPFETTRVQFEGGHGRRYLTFASHKNAASFGAIFWPICDWVTPLLEYYTARVRAVLLTETVLWGKDPAEVEKNSRFLFPPASISAGLLVEFGKVAGNQAVPRTNPSHIL